MKEYWDLYKNITTSACNPVGYRHLYRGQLEAGWLSGIIYIPDRNELPATGTLLFHIEGAFASKIPRSELPGWLHFVSGVLDVRPAPHASLPLLRLDTFITLEDECMQMLQEVAASPSRHQQVTALFGREFREVMEEVLRQMEEEDEDFPGASESEESKLELDAMD